MPRRSDTKRARLEAHLAELQPAIVDEQVWSELQRRLAPISNSYLRELLLASGVPVSPVVEGVRQDSLENAERTLLALAAAYTGAGPQDRRRIRVAVIESKDRLRWSLKQPNPEKDEILLWMMTWLENPEVFPIWLALRKNCGAGRLARSRLSAGGDN